MGGGAIGDEARADLRRRVAEGLLRAAVYLQSQMMLKLNKSNPRPYKTPSKEGEYPRKRTGAGQAGVTVTPTDPAAVAAALRVRVGHSANSWYIPYLALAKGRLGLPDLLGDLRPQLAALLTAGG